MLALKPACFGRGGGGGGTGIAADLEDCISQQITTSCVFNFLVAKKNHKSL